MKKSLLIAAAVMITFGACTNDDSAPEQREISFKSYAQKSSKAGYYGPMTDATYNVNEHFGVYAFLNTGSEETPVWATNNFMNNVEIEGTGADPDFVWKNANTTYYWPNIGSLTFACYSPYAFMQDGNTNTDVVSANKDNGISFTGFTAPTDNDKQIDLMVADLKKNQTYSYDLTYKGAVNVVFNHILSQIKFTAATTINFSSNTNVKGITIDFIKVHSLNTVGSYPSEEGKWTDLTTEATYEIPSVTVNLDKTTVNVNESLLVLPQDATGYSWDGNGTTDNNIFEVKYTITFSENFNDDDYDIPVEKTVYFQPTSEWIKGYIYTYNLQIGLNEITFAPEVVDKWVAGD